MSGRWQGAAAHVRRLEDRAADARIDADKALKEDGNKLRHAHLNKRADAYDKLADEWRQVARGR